MGSAMDTKPKPRMSAGGAALAAIGSLAIGGVFVLGLVRWQQPGSPATLPAFLVGMSLGVVGGLIALVWAARHKDRDTKPPRFAWTSPIVIGAAGAAVLLRATSIRWQVGAVTAMCVWFATVMLGARFWIANGGSDTQRPRVD
jgi:pimeloyl-ACP methyl ester carboxylesterase